MSSMRKVLNQEAKSLKDIKQQFISPTLHGQQHKSFSPSQASGGVALGFYRGKAQGVYETYLWLKKKFPKAAKAVFDNLIYEDGRRR